MNSVFLNIPIDGIPYFPVIRNFQKEFRVPRNNSGFAVDLCLPRENDGDLENDVNPLEAPQGNYHIIEDEGVYVLNRDTFAHFVKPKVTNVLKKGRKKTHKICKSQINHQINPDFPLIFSWANPAFDCPPPPHDPSIPP